MHAGTNWALQVEYPQHLQHLKESQYLPVLQVPFSSSALYICRVIRERTIFFIVNFSLEAHGYLLAPRE